MICFMALRHSHKGFKKWPYIVILVSLLPLELLLLVCFSAAEGRLLFVGYRIIYIYCGCSCQGFFLYYTNNCVNKSVLFGVFSVSGDWSSCVGGFPFLIKSIIYRLCSICIIQYMMLSIAAESQPFLFPIPPNGITCINTILNLVSIYFAFSSAASSETPTAASSASFSATFVPSFSSPWWVDLPSPSIPVWWWLVHW